jgi:hypothetical protein
MIVVPAVIEPAGCGVVIILLTESFAQCSQKACTRTIPYCSATQTRFFEDKAKSRESSLQYDEKVTEPK